MILLVFLPFAFPARLYTALCFGDSLHTRSWRFGRRRGLLRCRDLLLNSHAELLIHRRLAKGVYFHLEDLVNTAMSDEWQ